jgi:hypothetical protein
VRLPALSTVCAWCGRVRSRSGSWELRPTPPRTEIATHGICPDCLAAETREAVHALEGP